MSKVTINVRPNGPFVVTGEVEVLDSSGNPFPVTPGKPVALCRCGQSGGRPFCDGTHNRCGFAANETADQPPGPGTVV